jgi:hypothetical protein
MADPSQVFVERLGSGGAQRALYPIRLGPSNADSALKNGDVIHFHPKRPELSAGVTLRGAVSQARKVAWREGMKINDLIPNKADLVSKDSYRRQNEALFDFNERERTLRRREQIPDDLLPDSAKPASSGFDAQNRSGSTFGPGASKEPPTSTQSKLEGAEGTQSFAAWQTQRDRRLLSQRPKIDESKPKTLIEQVGHLLEAINLEYAVLERIDPKNLSVKVIPFNLRSGHSPTPLPLTT